jgi:hypothetical protein
VTPVQGDIGLEYFFGTDTATPFGPVRADRDLRFVARFRIPDWAPTAAHFEAATGDGSGLTARAAFTVRPQLPRTGPGPVAPVVGGLVLLLSAACARALSSAGGER